VKEGDEETGLTNQLLDGQDFTSAKPFGVGVGMKNSILSYFMYISIFIILICIIVKT
jgi:hypothetical protein